MLRIPLQAVPNQTLAVTLARQVAQITVRQNGAVLFFNLTVDGRDIVRTYTCRDRQRLLRSAQYRGFVGDFAFIDTQGADDPHWSGLGVRYQLIYFAAGE